MADLRKAAFIDRDGVINRELGYVHRIEDFEIIPEAVIGLRTLQAAGFILVVVTNQAGIARGLYTEAAFERLTEHMEKTLSEAGVYFHGVYYCPHHPDGRISRYRSVCSCRKPRPGMLQQAACDLSIDLNASIIVGDKASDIAAGKTAGVRYAVLVRSGHAISADEESTADACLPDLAAAADWVVTRQNA